MGTHRLIPHPDSPPGAIESVEVELERSGEGLWLRYTICAPLDGLVLPEPARPIRVDGLWQTTCLEAFVHDGTGEGYREFNFSPSSEWAAYRLTAYRAGMEALAMPATPDIALDVSDHHLALETTVPLEDCDHRVGLCAIVEEADGIKSYWALAHPSGPPDFHHPACFALRLPAPSAA